MKKWILSISLAAGVIGLSACSSNGDSEVVVETKAGNVTKDELYEAMKDKYGQQVLQELVYQKVLEENYEVTDEELNTKIEELKRDLGANFEMALQQYGYKNEEELKETLKIGLLQEKAALKDVEATEDELKEYYENFKPEVHARHILVADEATAKEVMTKLDEGAKFEELATEYSQDPGSAQNGGDLGWFGPGKMVPEFEETAYALEPNEISDPVKSEFGYHIIQVLEKKEKKPFEEMKAEIEREVKIAKLDGEKVQAAMDAELENANVKVKDEELKDTFKKPEKP